MTMELADETDDEEQVLAMQGELLTRCLLHLHGILHLHVVDTQYGVGGRILHRHVFEAGRDLLTLRSRGLGLGLLRSLGRRGMFIHNVVEGGFGWRKEP